MEAAIVNLTILALDQQQRGENGGGRRLMLPPSDQSFIYSIKNLRFFFLCKFYLWFHCSYQQKVLYIYWCWQFLNDYIYDVVNSFIIKEISVLDYD